MHGDSRRHRRSPYGARRRDLRQRGEEGRLAREIGISRTVLAVRFRTLVGASPIAYLTRWRMLQAARLLHEPGAAVAEVAGKVGYSSEAAFAKAFKRTLERTPGQVRRAAPPP